MEANNAVHRIDGIVSSRVVDPNRIWSYIDRDDMMARRNDDIETISENLAYRKHLRYLEFETREFFEQETSNQNIENIGTRLDKTQLYDNQMT